jgi:hypothetical protein
MGATDMTLDERLKAISADRMTIEERLKSELLAVHLAVAVPLWIERYRDTNAEEARRRAQICVQVTAEHGDLIQYRSKNETAEAFNRLAEGVAIASFQPGGITIFGLHFETTPPLRSRAEFAEEH